MMFVSEAVELSVIQTCEPRQRSEPVVSELNERPLPWLAKQSKAIIQTMTSSTTASQEELKANRVPVAWRDGCSAYVHFLLFVFGRRAELICFRFL